MTTLDYLTEGIREIERATGNKVTAIWAGPGAYRKIVMEAGHPIVYENITVECIGSTEG